MNGVCLNINVVCWCLLDTLAVMKMRQYIKAHIGPPTFHCSRANGNSTSQCHSPSACWAGVKNTVPSAPHAAREPIPVAPVERVPLFKVKYLRHCLPFRGPLAMLCKLVRLCMLRRALPCAARERGGTRLMLESERVTEEDHPTPQIEWPCFCFVLRCVFWLLRPPPPTPLLCFFYPLFLFFPLSLSPLLLSVFVALGLPLPCAISCSLLLQVLPSGILGGGCCRRVFQPRPLPFVPAVVCFSVLCLVTSFCAV